jgi:hypothetical protein
MAYVYAKNQSELKKRLSKLGVVPKSVVKSTPKYDLDGEKRYFVTLRKKKR